MDNNQKVLTYFVGGLGVFIIAAITQYVLGAALIGWGVDVVLTICALALLFCAAAPQTVERRMPGPLRTFLFVIGAIACCVFSWLFISTLALFIIFMVAFGASTVVGILRSN